MRAIMEWHLAFEKGFSVMVSQRGAITGARRAAVALSLAHATPPTSRVGEPPPTLFDLPHTLPRQLFPHELGRLPRVAKANAHWVTGENPSSVTMV